MGEGNVMRSLIFVFVPYNEDVEIKSAEILDRLSIKAPATIWINSQLLHDRYGNKRGALAES